MMSKEKITEILVSPVFKRITFGFGIVFLLGTIFLAVNPEPFLRFGYAGVFVSTALGGTSLIVFPLARHLNIYGLAFAMAFGMAINDSVAWVIGNSGKSIFVSDGRMKKIEATVERFGMIAIFSWSLIPFPYDLIGLVAGYVGLPYHKYVIPTFLGKFIRFVAIGLGVTAYFSS